MIREEYVGRFAPSPSGRLHFGSLVAAVASFLDARACGGKWLVRVEDIDDRTRPGAAEEILRDLEALGLGWDGQVVYQSQRTALYREAFERLKEMHMVYPCACSRRDVVGRYSGLCAAGLKSGQSARSWRVRVGGQSDVTINDGIFGVYTQNVQETVGDFIVRRADGPFAYQLAVVVDDHDQGVTHVVRGADLLDNAPRQRYLQQCLGLREVRYGHVPVVTDERGQKLSKSTGAAALNLTRPSAELVRALLFLGQVVPAEISHAPVDELLRWATTSWEIKRVWSSAPVGYSQ